ncbi:MAG: carbohydrate ABC transporter permease [Thermomicrobiales bacterium]
MAVTPTDIPNYVIPAQSKAAKRLQLLERFATHLVLLIFAIIVVYPVIWMAMASVKSQGDLLDNIWGLPSAFRWSNYSEAWKAASLGRALFNSIFVSLSTVGLVIAIAAPCGYALAKFKLRFGTLILLVFVLTMQAPVPVIPLYVLLVKLHLTNSYIGYILPLTAGGLPLAIFVFRAFFTTIPRDLEDAAVVDGSTQLGAFLRIVMPISVPAVATVAILQFLASWNEYFLALILIRSPELRTLPLAIQVFFYDWGRTDWGPIFAALSVGSIPMILLYIVMQRRFVQGLTAGAVKG